MWAVGAEVQAGQAHLMARLPVTAGSSECLGAGALASSLRGPDATWDPKSQACCQARRQSLYLSSHEPDVKGAEGLDVMPPVIDLRQVRVSPPD